MKTSKTSTKNEFSANPVRHRCPRFCTAIISICGIAGSAAVLIPRVQRFIIQFAEIYLIRRKVNFYDDWMHTLAAWARGGIAVLLIIDFFTLTGFGRKLFEEIRGEIKNSLAEIPAKALIKPFLLVLTVYLLGILGIIRADFFYIDDMDRAVRGYHGWNGWSRHLSDILSTFIHTDTRLADISPLPQILAVFLTAAATTALIYIFCGEKPTTARLLAAVPLGLSPYFLENYSYKFDAPYMALSVLLSIVPFLFLERKKAFVFVSIISLLGMCMTYQASSGIYIMITAALVFDGWNYKKKTGKELFAFTVRTLGSFVCSLVFFRLVFMVNGTTGHGVSTEIFPPERFLPGIIKNITSCFAAINADFGMAWKLLIAVICVLFAADAAKRSAQKGVKRILAPCLLILFLFTASYGVYIVLENPLFAPRALYGFGACAAIISVFLVESGKKTALAAVIALNWCFFVFAFSYGNALADQKRYTHFRVELLLSDLNALFPGRNGNDMEIHLENNIGFGPLTENIAHHYPVIKRLVPLNRHYQFYKYMTEYFHWEKGKAWEDNSGSLPVIFDSYYHVIKSDGKRIVVLLKE
jgi:hypothetical protein